MKISLTFLNSLFRLMINLSVCLSSFITAKNNPYKEPMTARFIKKSTGDVREMLNFINGNAKGMESAINSFVSPPPHCLA